MIKKKLIKNHWRCLIEKFEPISPKTDKTRGEAVSPLPRGWHALFPPRIPTGGESGIRTHGSLSRTHALQACPFDHSGISPALLFYKKLKTNGSYLLTEFCSPF